MNFTVISPVGEERGTQFFRSFIYAINSKSNFVHALGPGDGLTSLH